MWISQLSQPRSFSLPVCILFYSFSDSFGHEDAVMWLCTETLLITETQVRAVYLVGTSLSLTGLWKQSLHGKNEGFTFLCFYTCELIMLNDQVKCINNVSAHIFFLSFLFFLSFFFLPFSTFQMPPPFRNVLLQFERPHTQCLCTVL